MVMRTPVPFLIALAAIAPIVAGAQTTASDTAPARALPSRCISVRIPAPPVSDSARNAAREIAGRAQAASIVGDNAAAAALYQQAARLDPTDASTAYALGRGYEAAGDARAMAEYCRFLSLSPTATEAADVRQRIAQLALALPPDTTVVRIPVATAPRMPSPGAAFGAGLIIPGMGQFMTHRPAGGVLVMLAAGAAVWYGLQSENVSSQVTRTGIDPFGNPYQYQTTAAHTEHPHAAVGIGAAGAVGLIAAIDALVYANGHNQARGKRSASSATTESGSRLSAFPLLNFGQRSVGLGFALR